MDVFAEELKRLRVAKGLTQLELAEQAELNIDTLRRYEQGKRRPELVAGFLLARALGVTLDSLAELAWKNPLPKQPASKRKSPARGRPPA